jgi:hypothetical protein
MIFICDSRFQKQPRALSRNQIGISIGTLHAGDECHSRVPGAAKVPFLTPEFMFARCSRKMSVLLMVLPKPGLIVKSFLGVWLVITPAV